MRHSRAFIPCGMNPVRIAGVPFPYRDTTPSVGSTMQVGELRLEVRRRVSWRIRGWSLHIYNSLRDALINVRIS